MALPRPRAWRRGSSPQPVWPFPTRNPGQYRRVDQGWDLQYAGTTPVPVLAVVSGTLQNAGPDPGGFGPGYPLLVLDTPVFGYPAIYYGHTFTIRSKIGRRVAQGDPVGMTGGLHSGGNAYPDSNWLEIGFWDNGPAAGGVAGASVPGQQMQGWLTGAPVHVGGPPPPVPPARGQQGRPPLVVALIVAGMYLGAFGLVVLAAAGASAGMVWLASKAAES